MGRPGNEASGKKLLFECITFGLWFSSAVFLVKYALDKLDPHRERKKAAVVKRAMLAQRLGKLLDLDSHEDSIACDAVNPDFIDVTLADVGGLEDTKTALNNKVILPLKKPELFSGFLLRQAKGVLLYGPPGTGKTMLAKALAKEAGANFINIKASSLQSKWFGETQKLTTAVFTLAYKLQPCIIFMDEVDALLGKRRENEHDAITTMKTEFMQLWDGFNTDPTANVMVLAATNRPYDLDEAVLRRFSLQLEVGMPNANQRESILRLILSKQHKESMGPYGGLAVDQSLTQNTAGPDGRRPLAKIAEQTEGFSGSDLLELCSRAAALSIQEHLSTRNTCAASSSGSNAEAIGTPKLRSLQLKDFTQVLGTYKPSTHQVEAYRSQVAAHEGLNSASIDQNLLAQLALSLLFRGNNPQTGQ